MKPHIKDFISLWSGEFFYENGLPSFYKVAIFCISSDVPATRKLGGFKSHNAIQGCSKCKKSFTRTNSSVDYSGYDMSTWERRDDLEHKILAEESTTFSTLESENSFQKKHGVRYSELFKLPYFLPIKMHVIDPMHNLFLGVAKHTFQVWLDVGVLNSAKLDEIDLRQEKLKIPGTVGRLAHCISKAHKRMKADEWKNWTLIYSLFCLRNVISAKYLNHWSMFVNACLLLCKRSIDESDAAEAHNLLRMFCLNFVSLFGYQHCTPNMHLMLHLKECIHDFGSVYSFWCFSFERYNGILGNYNTNNHSISVQVMRQFQSGFQLRNCSTPVYLDDDRTKFDWESEAKRNLLMFSTSFSLNEFNDMQIERLLATPSLLALSPSDNHLIASFFIKTNPHENVRIGHFVEKIKRCDVSGTIIDTRKDISSLVIARYFGKEIDLESVIFRPAEIINIYRIKIFRKIDNGQETKSEQIILECNWLKKHPYVDFYGVNSPTKIWASDFESKSAASFIPSTFIKSRFVFVKETVNFTDGASRFPLCDSVKIVIPLPSKSII